MIVYRLGTRDLSEMPTITQGWTCDLKIDDPDLGVRVWLARTGLADGEPFENKVTVEILRDGRWIEGAIYDGDNP